MTKKKWWKKVEGAWDKVEDAFADAADTIVDAGTDLLEDGTDLVKNGKCYQTVNKLQETGKECYQLARDTSDLCTTTQKRGQDMIDFGSEITSTLRGFSSKMDVETLETIKDLMDGDRLRESMALAKDMDDIALTCVDKSVRMMTIMEDTMDTVPDRMQGLIAKAAGDDDKASLQEQKRTREALSTLDQDLADVKSCINSLQHLNIATALKVGTQAFEHLSAKATLSRSMFQTMRGFSDEVAGYTKAISEGDIPDMFKLATKVKDMWHCLTLSGFMKALAEATGKLIRLIIDLFKAMSDRLSTLWAALAFAKDCMVDCIDHVLEAKNLVLNAHKKSSLLIERSRSITQQLQGLGKLDMESLSSARNLTEGGEIKEAIELATTMDDLVIECSGKVVSMIERVTEGFRNLPDIITADIDMEEEGKKDGDAEPDDIEENIAKLEQNREAIEKSDIISAAIASVDGFRDVLDNEDTCQNMLSNVEGFTGNCNSTIESFLGVWDLESAMVKISEMCRMVRLGELIKKFAEQIKRLLKAIIELMKSTFQKLSINSVDDLKNKMNEVKDEVKDTIDEVKDKMNEVTDKLKFWK